MTLEQIKLELHEMQRLMILKEKISEDEENYFNRIKSKYGMLKECGNKNALIINMKNAIADIVMKNDL